MQHSYTQFYDQGNKVVKKTGSEEAQAWINALNSDTFFIFPGCNQMNAESCSSYEF